MKTRLKARKQYPDLSPATFDRRLASAELWLPLAAAIIGAISGLVAKFFSSVPWWPIFGLALLGIILSTALTATKATRSARTEKRKWHTQVRNILILEDLPFVKGADPYSLGVKRGKYSRGSDPYVERNIDRRLRRSLREATKPYPIVIVTGRRLSGKTRSAFEAIRAARPDTRIVAPMGGFDGLKAFIELDPPVDLGNTGSTFWIDELTVDSVDLASPGLIRRVSELGPIVCTVELSVLTQLETGGPSVPAQSVNGSALIARARASSTCFSLPLAAEPDELIEARNTYPRELFAESIGEPLATTNSLGGLVEQAKADSSPGYLLTQAFADWRSASGGKALSRIELLKLFNVYYSGQQSGLSENAAFDLALDWTTHSGDLPTSPIIALDDDHFELVDQAVYELSNTERDTAASGYYEKIVDYMKEIASPEPGLLIGIAVRILMLGDRRSAAQLFSYASQLDDSQLREFALLGEAIFDDDRNVRDLPRELLEDLCQSPDSTIRNLARGILADKISQSDPAGAIEIYRQLYQESRGDERGSFALTIAELSTDPDEIIALCEEATILGSSEIKDAAYLLLAKTVFPTDRERATRIFRMQAEGNTVSQASKAAAHYVTFLTDIDGGGAHSRAALQTEVREGPPRTAGLAAIHLGLYEEKRNPSLSLELYEKGITPLLPDELSRLALGGWRQTVKSLPEKDQRRFLERAISAENRVLASFAATELALLVRKLEPERAMSLCQEAMESDHTYVAETAAGILALTLEENRPEAAFRLLTPLLNSPYDEIRDNAHEIMARVVRRNDPERTVVLARTMIQNLNGEARCEAALRFAPLVQTINNEYAEELFSIAASSNNSEIWAPAKILLAGHVGRDDIRRAETLADDVIAHGNAAQGAVAAMMLYRIYLEIDRAIADSWLARSNELLEQMPPDKTKKESADELDPDKIFPYWMRPSN